LVYRWPASLVPGGGEETPWFVQHDDETRRRRGVLLIERDRVDAVANGELGVPHDAAVDAHSTVAHPLRCLCSRAKAEFR
jgi:hypothetical protein